MRSQLDFRLLAENCLHIAEETTSERHRDMLISMAEAWYILAEYQAWIEASGECDVEWPCSARGRRCH
jgi:hypothetical protein